VLCLTTLDAKRLKGGVARERHFLDFFFVTFFFIKEKESKTREKASRIHATLNPARSRQTAKKSFQKKMQKPAKGSRAIRPLGFIVLPSGCRLFQASWPTWAICMQPTPNRAASSLLECPRCEGGRRRQIAFEQCHRTPTVQNVFELRLLESRPNRRFLKKATPKTFVLPFARKFMPAEHLRP